MNLFETLKDLLLRFLSIDKSLTDLEETAKNLTQNNAALRDKLQEVADRVLALEKEAAKASDLQELKARVAFLEKSRDMEQDRVTLELERFQLQVERFGVHLSQLPNVTPPQLPPSNDPDPTDN